MRILDEACVVTFVEQDDLWRTERRSSGWMVGDAPPVESDAPQRADARKILPARSDWSIGDAPADQTDYMQLALVPVQNSRTSLGGSDAVVAGALTQERLVELLGSNDSPLHVGRVAERDGTRRSPV